MSFYKGKRSEKIRQLWMTDKQNEQALRQWLAQNGYAQVSLTIFTFLSHYEPVRKKFLRFHATARRKKSPPDGSEPRAAK